jgi:dUTP pyrophosphatase
MLEIKIKYFDEDMPKLTRNDSQDWIDLRAAEEIFMESGEFKLIPLGVAMQIPEGYEAHIVPRSSTFKNYRIIQANSKGIVDNKFNGPNDQWHMPVVSLGGTHINKYDRICQFRLIKKMEEVSFTESDLKDNTDRGGFGHSGVK